MQQRSTNSSDPTPLLGEPLVNDQARSVSNRSFFFRMFKPILPGAMRGSIFAFLASAMGTGMFNLPYRIDQIGVVAYFIFVVCGGLFSYFGMYLISRIILKFNVESYSAMSEEAYGKWFRKVAELCLLAFPWGIVICYQVIFAKFILQLLADNFDFAFYEGTRGRQLQIYTPTGQLVRICVSAGAIVINLFFILKKKIGILQKVSIIGVISVFTNILIIILTLFIGFKAAIKDEETKVVTEYVYHGVTKVPWENIKWLELDGWDAFSRQMQGLASLMFCYVNHQLVFPLVFDLTNPTKKRLDTVFNIVHLIEIIAYFLVGLAGYLLLAQHITERPINPLVMASIQTITMSVGKGLMIFTLFFAVPLNLFPARQVVYKALEIQKNNKNHIILSLVLAFSTTAIAIVFQKVNSYFGLLGGTAGVMMAGVIPSICYVKLIGMQTLKQKLIIIFMAIVSVMGMLGAFLSVIVPS